MGANGENPQRVLSGPAGDLFAGVGCLRDPDRLLYGRLHPPGDHFDITAESLHRKTGQVTVAFSDPNITAGVVLPEGRLIYSRLEPPPNQGGFANLWEIGSTLGPVVPPASLDESRAGRVLTSAV